MRSINRYLLLVALASPLAWSADAQAGPVTLTVSGARNADGVVRCGLFASAAGFREAGREAFEAVGKIAGGRAVCAFKSVPAGSYAAAVFHAEKGERKTDIGMFGKPKQGVGFSRNPSITFGPPDFNAAAFAVSNDPANLSIKLVY